MPSKYTTDPKTILEFNRNKHAELNILPNHPHVYFWKPRTVVRGVIDAAVCCNWWRHQPVKLIYAGRHFSTAEHAMMWAKADLFNDSVAKKAILESRDPWDAKAIGRQVKGFKDVIWDTHSYDIVKEIVLRKFTQDKQLREWLMSQHPDTVFVEASPLDYIWGVKLAADDIKVKDMQTWRGYNLLGYAIIEVMRILRAAQ